METGTKMNITKRCPHNRQLWWNYGDGKPRHMSESGNTPMMIVCEEASRDREEYRA